MTIEVMIYKILEGGNCNISNMEVLQNEDMIDIKDKSQCCGCSACKEVCPKQCIKFEVDEEGFWYPKVDASTCIECGACESVCPITNQHSERNEKVKTVIAYDTDNAHRLGASSGGLFGLMATEIINRGGIVFGAAFDENYSVHHIGVDTLVELERLKGSKYVQSNPEHVYTEVKKELASGRDVLFTGTACQIQGLKSYLKKEYDNLYTADVICHGAPTPKLWDQYLEEQKTKHDNSKIEDVIFRDKSTGWKTYSVKIKYENGQEDCQQNGNNKYMRLFLSNVCLRPSCYTCNFKDLKVSSDFTMGDCWGIENFMPEMDDDKGTSVLLIHTPKGENLFEKICPNLLYKEADMEQALKSNPSALMAVAEPKNRKRFFTELNKGASIDELSKIIKPSLKIRIKYKIKNEIKKIIGR